VADDPAPYLLPAGRADGVTLEFMARLFRQARDAEALAAAQGASASTWFDDHRAALVRAAGRGPRLVTRRYLYAGLRARLRESVAVVEETNRVLGPRQLVEQVRGSGRTTLADLRERAQNAAGLNEHDWPLPAWGLDGGGGPP
jgi:hypothetical protein